MKNEDDMARTTLRRAKYLKHIALSCTAKVLDGLIFVQFVD